MAPLTPLHETTATVDDAAVALTFAVAVTAGVGEVTWARAVAFAPAELYAATSNEYVVPAVSPLTA